MATSGHFHILFIPRWYPSEQDPMLGLFVKKHALAATKAGFRVSVAYAAAVAGRADGKKFHTTIQQNGALTEVIVRYLNPGGITGLWRQTAAWYKAVKACVQQQGQPDLIHAHILTRTAVIAALLSMIWRIPYLITEHWSRYYPENMQYRGWLRKLVTKMVVGKAGTVTVVSQRLADAMHKQGLIFTPELLPNVVDTTLFHPAVSKIESRQIVSITCFEEKSKNLRLLIDAFELVLNSISDARLVLVGTGVDLEITKSYVTEKHFHPGTVRFTGMLEGAALAEEIRASACLALSSNYETFGIVAFEALACGVPVVATDVADLGTFIGNRFGKIVSKGDKEAFANALIEVLSRQRQTTENEMIQTVRHQFGEEAISAKLGAYYHKLLKKENGQDQ